MNKKLIPLVLITTGLLLLVVVSFLVYREWSPADNSAASTYYLSPDGDDITGNGNNTSPWKTLDKANSSINPGDTVILRDGVYPAYFGITKSNTTWKAENKQKAILDGGFGPDLLQGRWDRIDEAYRSACAGKGDEVRLLTIPPESNNINIDDLITLTLMGWYLEIPAGEVYEFWVITTLCKIAE